MSSLHIEISGNGPALVLLHGWGLHGGIWNEIIPNLAEHFTVCNIDLPGFGHSQVIPETYSLVEISQLVIETLEQKNIQSYYLMGWSLGGLVSTYIALEHSKKIKKLITVASNPCFVADDEWKNGMQAKVLSQFIESLTYDYSATLQRFLMIQTMGSPTQKEDIKALKRKVLSRGEPSQVALKGGLEVLNDINLVQRLPDLKMPMLRIYGHLDSLVPKSVASDVDALLPNSQSIIYRKAAHAPFLSVKEEFLDDVSRFLID